MRNLPASIDKDSIRVDGRGKGIISEVQYLEKHVEKGEDVGQKRKEIQKKIADSKETLESVSAVQRGLVNRPGGRVV